jgi:hypothetical protein
MPNFTDQIYPNDSERGDTKRQPGDIFCLFPRNMSSPLFAERQLMGKKDKTSYPVKVDGERENFMGG